jgi:uncharacterized protein YndB with AHSA1/START domain
MMRQQPSSKLTVTTPSDTEIVMTREFAAPRSLVFEAFTKPEHTRLWLGREGDTMSVCEVDLRAGGAWRYRWQLQEGGEMGMYGAFLEIEAPGRLVQTEHFEGEFFEVMGGGTVNTLVLEEREGVTLMTATVVYKSREARDGVLQTPMEQGAGESFDRLEELLAGLS